MTWMLWCFWAALAGTIGGACALAGGVGAGHGGGAYALLVAGWVGCVAATLWLLVADARVSGRSLLASLWVGIKDPLKWLVTWWPWPWS